MTESPPPRWTLSGFKEWIETTQAVVTICAIIIGGIWTYRLFGLQRENRPHASVAAQVSRLSLDDKHHLVQVVLKMENTGHTLLRVTKAFVTLQQILPIKGCGARGPCTVDELNDPIGMSERTNAQFDWPAIASRQELMSPAHQLEPGESEVADFEFSIPKSVEAIRVYGFVRNDETVSVGHPARGWFVAQIYNLNEPSAKESEK